MGEIGTVAWGGYVEAWNDSHGLSMPSQSSRRSFLVGLRAIISTV